MCGISFWRRIDSTSNSPPFAATVRPSIEIFTVAVSPCDFIVGVAAVSIRFISSPYEKQSLGRYPPLCFVSNYRRTWPNMDLGFETLTSDGHSARRRGRLRPQRV